MIFTRDEAALVRQNKITAKLLPETSKLKPDRITHLRRRYERHDSCGACGKDSRNKAENAACAGKIGRQEMVPPNAPAAAYSAETHLHAIEHRRCPMGVRNISTGVARKQPRTSAKHDLLSGVHGTEIDWAHVQPILQGMPSGLMPYVYFISEPDDGYTKIGTARDPVKRLRELQTGNARRLRIERIVYGDRFIEVLLHEYFREWMAAGRQQITTVYKTARARETEWFKPEARERLLEAADVIWRHQQQIERIDGNGITTEQLKTAVGEAMAELGYTLRREDTMRFLAQGPGYVTVGLGL